MAPLAEFLNDEQIAKIDLPKWPGCDVDGKDVTPEQAQEILVRTCYPYFLTNDREFGNQAAKIFYEAIPHPEWGEDWWVTDYIDRTAKDKEERLNLLRLAWGRQSKYHREIKLLNIEYLYNHRVCSSYIGGPYGWCNWDGKIHQRNINIGKWPSATEVFKEWATIAKAFPFLELTCRLLDHEAGYHENSDLEEPKIAVVFEVKDGEVKARTPVEMDHDPQFVTQCDNVDAHVPITFDFLQERGVSLDEWTQACKRVVSTL